MGVLWGLWSSVISQAIGINLTDIILKNLHKSFGNFVAVQNIDLTIKNGEFFVLLGPSGCGKTTTLRMIAGLEIPTSGEILLDEEDVTFLRASQRDIAFVFQLFALYPHMNVWKNLAFPLKMQNMSASEIKTRVLEVAKLLQIEHILKSKISGLAGGDRQRVALGRAIVRRPKAFLMDEPLGTLDAEFREQMSLELKKLHERIEATTIYVTHDQIEAMTMGDKIAVMDQGKVLQYGTPDEIYSRPATKFVGSFIGSPAMNFIPIESMIQAGDTEVQVGDQKLAITRQKTNSLSNHNYIGVRPEKLELNDNQGIPGKVYGNEYLGNRKICTVETGFGQLKVRVAKDTSININDSVRVKFSPESAILFDGQTELALLSENQ